MSTDAGGAEHLRRIAYGSGATPSERAVAEESLRELEVEARQQERALAAGSDVHDETGVVTEYADELGGEIYETVQQVEGGDTDEQRAEPSLWRRSIRVGWLVPIVVASLAVGYFVSLGPINAMRDAENVTGGATSPPSASEPESAEVELQMGSLEAADSWFDIRQFNEEDPLPFTGELESHSLTPQDVRLAVTRSDGRRVWVGRSAEGELCLLLANYADGESASACVGLYAFGRTGVRLTSGSFDANWFGRRVSTVPLLVDNAIELPAPGSLLGDLDAANAWFDSTAESPLDEPQVDGMLDGMGIAPNNVRRVVLDMAPWIKVWIAKQDTGGFCFIKTEYDGLTAEGACTSAEDFEDHGLTFGTFGFLFVWDGNNFSLSDLS